MTAMPMTHWSRMQRGCIRPIEICMTKGPGSGPDYTAVTWPVNRRRHRRRQRIAADRWLAVLIPHDDLRRLMKPSLAVRYLYSYTVISLAATTATPGRMCCCGTSYSCHGMDMRKVMPAGGDAVVLRWLSDGLQVNDCSVGQMGLIPTDAGDPSCIVYAVYDPPAQNSDPCNNKNTPLPMATEEQPLPSPEEATVEHEAPHQLDAARIVGGLRNSAG
ncbi:hypothetical protein FOZ61_010991 [Perkinsus olseni]|uniref:Uncharacterized protein n=1 Tax=Perkinsus olseni TaxID=32597 RepID=A0A7J6M1C2_PEROL|nr:hypothetical protein FOZ61_010991 [Perkinsus olseni]